MATLSGLLFNFSPKAAAAAIDCTKSGLTTQEAITCGSCNASGTTDCSSKKSATSLGDTFAQIINLISAAVGLLAVIMIIVAGFRYVTSGGKQESVQSAKNTLIYAIVGLIIVAFAQIIVHFVINKVTSSSSKGTNTKASWCVNGTQTQDGPHPGRSC